MLTSPVQQGLQGGLVVNDRSGKEPFAVVVEDLGEVLILAHVQPDPHLHQFWRGQSVEEGRGEPRAQVQTMSEPRRARMVEGVFASNATDGGRNRSVNEPGVPAWWSNVLPSFDTLRANTGWPYSSLFGPVLVQRGVRNP